MQSHQFSHLSDLENRLALSAVHQPTPATRWKTECLHSHPTPRLLIFTKGQGRITVAGLTSGYGPNNVIFIPAHTLFSYEIGPTVFGYMLSIPSAMAGDWPEEPAHMRLRDVVAQKELISHVDALERELKSDKEGHNRAALYLLGILSVFIERQLTDNPPKDTMARAATTSARLVAAYTDLVERYFATGKGVSDYAASLGVTATHLTRCCNQTCSRSAIAILQDRILFEARTLLQTTKIPVKDIAARLGFSSAAYFTRSFQGETKLTPSAFRKASQA
jgi:AraC family transcriptional regulator, transcriptional activator of pobA